MTLDNKIEAFRTYIKKIEALEKASALYHWDAATGAPKKAVNERSEVMGILDTEAFKWTVSDEMKAHLESLEAQKEQLDPVTAKIVKVYRKAYDQMTKIPVEEYQAFSVLCAQSSSAWEEAKEASDFTIFQPFLEKIVAYKRKFITYLGFEGHPYNTLLDDFEPGMTVEKLDEFFGKLKAEIVPLLQRVVKSPKKIREDFTKLAYEEKDQEKFSYEVLKQIGYDLERGMLKESAHPFTLGFSRNDVRITTHYYKEMVVSAIFSTIHEAGHAIYEQNIDEALSGTALETGTSMGIHESQSRFYENVIGRSYAFWKLFLPKAKELFPGQLEDVTVEQMYEAVNIAQPSLIRTEADELTYALHIMVRYEIEKKLMNNEIEVKDLPMIWNKAYKEYLGIEPENDARGVLQDVHWSEGMFGYFPSYALGNAYAAQFLAKMSEELDVEGLIEAGDFETIKNWLGDKIHSHGRLLDPNEIIEKVTGEALNAQYLVDYLKDKYSKIYEL